MNQGPQEPFSFLEEAWRPPKTWRSHYRSRFTMYASAREPAKAYRLVTHALK